MPKSLDAKEILQRNVQKLSVPTKEEMWMVPTTDAPLPSVDELQHIVDMLKQVIFHGFFDERKQNPEVRSYGIGVNLEKVVSSLKKQIERAIHYKFSERNREEVKLQASEIAISFLDRIPEIKRLLFTDVLAVFENDPAVDNYGEVIFSYPVIQAMVSYRIAHERKIIITVAPVCHVGKEIPEGCKNPLTPEEITEDVINCYKAGACEVHLHTRDLQGNPTFELDVFSDTIRRIREQSDMIIQSSTGGLSSLSLEQRCVCLNVPEVEVASLNLGSVNFGETVYVNTMPELRYWAKRLDETNTIPEMEFFYLSHVETATRLAIGILLISSKFFYYLCTV